MTDQAATWSWQEPVGDAGPATADWPTLYAQYLMRSASQSAKSTDLYQQIMECVARGQLAPTVFRDRLPTFVQTRGTDYATRLAEVNTRFFGGLVELNTRYARELMDVVLPGAAIPPVTPPAFDAADPLKWFQQLSDYVAQVNTAAVTAYQSLLEQVAAGQVTPDRAQANASDYLNQWLPEYLRRLSGLYFNLLNQLNDLRSGYETDFLASVLATAQPEEPDRPVALNVVGPLGGLATASLALTNTQAQPALIRGSVTDIRRADGVGPAFAPKLTITPETLELRPGEEGSLILSLRLEAGDYVPEVLYVADVHIQRQGEPRVELPLRVMATPASAAARPSAGAGGAA